jgi:hypothetical protein
MDYNKLLEKYWKGETSIEEERLLKAHMQSDKVEQDLQSFQPMFQYFKEQKNQQLDKEVVALIKPKTAKVKLTTTKSNFFYIRKIAAAILFIIIAGFAFQQFNQPTKEERMLSYWESKEIKDPKIAYQKTKAALLLVSTKLNNGTGAALNQFSKIKKVGQYVRY